MLDFRSKERNRTLLSRLLNEFVPTKDLFYHYLKD